MKKLVALQLLDAMANIDALLGATMDAGTAQVVLLLTLELE